MMITEMAKTLYDYRTEMPLFETTSSEILHNSV